MQQQLRVGLPPLRRPFDEFGLLLALALRRMALQLFLLSVAVQVPDVALDLGQLLLRYQVLQLVEDRLQTELTSARLC